MQPKRFFPHILVLAFIALLPASQVLAQAYTLPTSSKLVHGTLTLSDGQKVEFTVLEGAMFTIRDEESDFFLGFTPTIEDEAEERVSFEIFEIQEMGPDLQTLKEVDDVLVLKTFEVGSPWMPAYSQLTVRGISDSGLNDVEIEQLREDLRIQLKLSPSSKPGENSVEPTLTGQSQCCVTCGSVTACGCAVQMSCGSCCSGACCSGDGLNPDVNY